MLGVMGYNSKMNGLQYARRNGLDCLKVWARVLGGMGYKSRKYGLGSAGRNGSREPGGMC